MNASRIVSMLVPLLLTPLLFLGIAEGYLNFGGGEKDLFLLVPWFLWSLGLVVAGLLVRAVDGYLAWLGRAVGWSVLVIFLAWLILLAVNLAST